VDYPGCEGGAVCYVAGADVARIVNLIERVECNCVLMTHPMRGILLPVYCFAAVNFAAVTAIASWEVEEEKGEWKSHHFPVGCIPEEPRKLVFLMSHFSH